MLASDADIEKAMNEGILRVYPTEPLLIQPASLDLRLDRFFRAYAPMPPLHLEEPTPVIDPAREQPEMMYSVEVEPGDCYLLQPLSFALAATVERISVGPQIAAALEGKSSLGRLGLLVHATAGWIDPGFEGHITLELFNAAPYAIKLYPGMKIAQLAIMGLRTPTRMPYGSAARESQYQYQPRGPQPSRSWRTFRAWPTPAGESSMMAPELVAGAG